MSIISPASLAIVKATAPVVAENATKITTTFYPLMLSRHPELLNIFNKSNQVPDASGVPRQARVLADSIIAYATNIEHLERLGEAVDRIAHKHCALGVKAHHYQIVHDNLMEAIGKVLGEAVTAEVAAAWSEAVMALAKILIEVEDGMYKSAAEKQWSGLREFTLAKVDDESACLRSFYFKPKDGGPVGAFVPGQYVTVFENPTEEKYFAPRHYTVTSAPDEDHVRISVKKFPQGTMSSYLHSLAEGATVSLGPIFGPDLLAATDPAAPVVFVSAGSGITPTVAMMPAAAAKHPKVAVFHADASPAEHAFDATLRDLLPAGSPYATWYSHAKETDALPEHATRGRMTGEAIADKLLKAAVDPTKSHYLVCAGVGKNRSSEIAASLTKAGVPSKQLHIEFFGPAVNIDV